MFVAALTCAPVAVAGNNPVLLQCGSGSLAGEYSIGQLRQALDLLTAAAKQYTSCQDVIQQALEAQLPARQPQVPALSGSWSRSSVS